MQRRTPITPALARGIGAALGIALGTGLAPGPVEAQIPSAPRMRSLTLPAPGPHWTFLVEPLLRRAAWVDASDGRFLGMLSAGMGLVVPHVAPDADEIYLAETHYARGTRGVRTDVVTVYDARTLSPLAEIEIPPRRADLAGNAGSSALSDDGRFLAVFNLTPATSLSIVDVGERRFASEIETPGCSLVYAAGSRRFLMLCGDGSVMAVDLDEAGGEAAKLRSPRFFDPQEDPITEKGARHGSHWLFASFEGWIHPVDVGSDPPSAGTRWSLFDDADRAGSWRIGGLQHLAVHHETGRLYALVHQGGPHTHKTAGTEVWAYDLAKRERLLRIPLRNPAGVFLAEQMGVDAEGALAGIVDWLLQTLLPNPGMDLIGVTQDDAPLLLAAASRPGAVSVYDALSGEHLHDLEEMGISVRGLETR